MQLVKRRNLIHLSFLLFLTTSLAGCNDIQLTSKWRDHEISIDGDQADWSGTLRFLKDEQASVGVLNDGDFLYLCLVSSNQGPVMQTVRSGFTVWFDAEGGKNRSFGIKFPLGMQGSPMPMMDRSRTEKPEIPREFLDASLKEIEILGPGQAQVATAPDFSDQGIEVKIIETYGRLVYELKVPLVTTSDYPYAIGAHEGKPVGIGFETGEPDRPKMMEPPGGGGFPGGGRMPPGGKRGPRPEMPEPIKLWLKVNLASPTSSD